MTAGHFGLAAGVKAYAPKTPLWALMVATYLLDFAFILCVGAGLERFAPITPEHPAYGQVTIQALYTHSLLGAVALAGFAMLATRGAWGRRAPWVIGSVVLSHWFLDLVVHRPDLPFVPANAAGLPLLGLGLWRVPIAAMLTELALCISGTLLYARARLHTVPSPATGRSVAAPVVTGLLLMSLLAADFFAAPMPVTVLLMLLLIVLCGWLDAQ